MKKEPEGQTEKQRSNVVPLRGRLGAMKEHGVPAPAGIEGRREPTGEDVVTMLLGCAPEGVLRELDLGRDTSAEWASLIESDRTVLERKLWLHVTGSPSSRADQAEAFRGRSHYAGIAGLALVYAFLKPAWRRANPSARDTVWRVGAPYDVLMQFGESLRCEIEDREAGVIGDQDRHYGAVVVALKADRDAARAERDALKAAEIQGKRKRSHDARKGSEARWAEEGAGGKPADKAKAKYLPRMLAWVKAHPTPEKAKSACTRHFHPMIEAEYGKDAPAFTTVRSWLQGK
jgi:hypothetical protein